MLFGLFLLLASIIVPSIGSVQERARRTADSSHLRQIGQATLIYAQSHDDHLPVATDIWDYALALAEDGGADEPRLWWSKSDPASDDLINPPVTILLPGSSRPRPIIPAFRTLKLSVAVPLGKLNTRMPATTPIAWTRGLQTDGTWSSDSPYETDGGFITFLAGNVAFYKTLGTTAATGQLTRYDGQGPTNNILEALPPGTRIAEYTPTPEEKTAWAQLFNAAQREKRYSIYGLILFFTLLWLPFVIICVYRLIKKRPGAFTVLLWPVFLILLFIIVVPFC